MARRSLEHPISLASLGLWAAVASSGCGLMLDTDGRDDAGLDGGAPDARVGDGSRDDGNLDGALDSASPDATTVDGSPTDAPRADVAPDAPPACSPLCGDVDQNGVLDTADERRAFELTAAGAVGSPCELANADVLRTGTITDADALLVSAIVGGYVSGGCAPCDLTCGDANGDGSLDVSDTAFIVSFPAVADFCQFWAADTTGDGVVDAVDGEIVSDYLLRGRAEPACAMR